MREGNSGSAKMAYPLSLFGVAYANLGQIQKAKERLEYVVQRAGNDPNFKQAGELLGRKKTVQ
jgi:hypothetical protein